MFKHLITVACVLCVALAGREVLGAEQASSTVLKVQDRYVKIQDRFLSEAPHTVVAKTVAVQPIYHPPAPQAPDVLRHSLKLLKHEVRALRDAIYTEARGEPEAGQCLVGWVIVTRAMENRPGWGGESYRAVVYKRSRSPKGGMVSQFSGPIHHPVKVPDNDPQLKLAEDIAVQVMSGECAPPEHLRRARYYQRPEHADPKRSAWFATRVKLGRVGNHVFYADPLHAERTFARAKIKKKKPRPPVQQALQQAPTSPNQ